MTFAPNTRQNFASWLLLRNGMAVTNNEQVPSIGWAIAIEMGLLI